MALILKTKIEDGKLICNVSGTFIVSESLELFDKILYICLDNNILFVEVDICNINDPTTSINKLLWAYGVEDCYLRFTSRNKIAPRIAIYGQSPFIVDSYQPGTEHLISENIPVRVFTCKTALVNWLY